MMLTLGLIVCTHADECILSCSDCDVASQSPVLPGLHEHPSAGTANEPAASPERGGFGAVGERLLFDLL